MASASLPWTPTRVRRQPDCVTWNSRRSNVDDVFLDDDAVDLLRPVEVVIVRKHDVARVIAAKRRLEGLATVKPECGKSVLSLVAVLAQHDIDDIPP